MPDETIFAKKDSVFFVGGRGTKAGDANAGGCTKEYWGDIKNPNKTLADVMENNGAPVSYQEAWDGDQAACDVTEGDGNVEIFKSGNSYFEYCEIGLVVNVKFAGVYPDGRYEVISQSNDYVGLDLDYISDTTCDAKVGGAFNYIQRASDVTDAANYNVDILTNKDRTFTMVPHTIDIDTGGGNLAINTWKRIIGIDDNGIELAVGSYVTIDGDGLAMSIFKIDNVMNVIFRHIHACNTIVAPPFNQAGFTFPCTGVTRGIVLLECKSINHGYAVYISNSNAQNISVISGVYEGSTRAIFIASILNGTIQGADISSIGNYVIYMMTVGVSIIGNTIRSDGTGLGVYAGGQINAVITENVFYNVTDGIFLAASLGNLVEYNNIFVVSLAASGKAIKNSAGGISYSDYSCLWAMDGAPVAANRWGGQNKGEHSIEADPQFKDAANGDFRLKVISSPAYTTGRPTLGQL